MPRVTSKATKQQRHDPLHTQITEDDTYRKFGRVSQSSSSSSKSRRKGQGDGDDLDGEENGNEAVGKGEDARMSRKILELAREQQEEIRGELGSGLGLGLGMDDDDDDDGSDEPIGES